MGDLPDELREDVDEIRKLLLLAVSVAGLTGEEAEVFLLSVVGNPEGGVYPIHELASYLGRPSGVIRRLLDRALVKIKRTGLVPDSDLPADTRYEP